MLREMGPHQCKRNHHAPPLRTESRTILPIGSQPSTSPHHTTSSNVRERLTAQTAQSVTAECVIIIIFSSYSPRGMRGCEQVLADATIKRVKGASNRITLQIICIHFSSLYFFCVILGFWFVLLSLIFWSGIR